MSVLELESKKKTKGGKNKLILLILLGMIIMSFFVTNTLLEEEKKFIKVPNSLKGTISNVEISNGIPIGESGIGWKFIIKEDSKQEVDVEIIEINKTTLELTLFEHQNSTTPQNYRWDMTLCNLTGSGLQYMEEDTQGGFEFAIPLDVNYEKLVNFGLNETWCGSGDGYILFSNGAKNQFPKNIRLILNNISNFTLFAGTGSVVVDAIETNGLATAYGPNENFCIATDGSFHVTWEGAASDWWYGNSTDDGVTWQTREMLEGTVLFTGVTCSPNGNITIYSLNNGDIDMFTSDDFGATFSSIITVEDDVDTISGPVSAVVDSNNINHFCAIDNDDDLIYVNTSNLNSGLVISSSDSDQCDIGIDSGDIPFVSVLDTTADSLDIMTATDEWVTRTVVDGTLGTVQTTFEDGVTIFINGSDNIYLSSIHTNDLQFCNGTTGLGSWTCFEVDASNSFNPDIVQTQNNDIFIFYQSTTNDGGLLFYTNSSNQTGFVSRQTLKAEGGFTSVAHSKYANTNNITTNAHFVYTVGAVVTYDNLTVTPPPSSPVMQTPAINDSEVFINDFVNHTINIQDVDNNLDSYTFSWNASGASCDTFVNASPVSISGGNVTIGNTTLIPSTCENKAIGFRFYANDSSGLISESSTIIYQVLEYGTLNVSIELPADNSNYSTGDVNLTINSTVSCFGGVNARCGTVFATSRYNVSATTPDTTINITDGATPFFIQGQERGSCYQESSNVTNQTGIDGDCSLVYDRPYSITGNWITPENLVDGDFGSSTASGTVGFLFVNYTKPIGANSSSKFRFATFGSSDSYDIPQSCWDHNNTKMIYRIEGSNTQNFVNATCFNGVDWIDIFEIIDPAGRTNEEAMNWSFPFVTNPSTSSQTLESGESQTFNWTLNITSTSAQKFLIDVFFNSSFGSSNVADNDTDNITVGLNLVAIVGDTCSCPTINTNWEIDLTDSCQIYTDCDIGTGNISFINTGNATFNATITAKNMNSPPDNNGVLFIGPQCLVNLG